MQRTKVGGALKAGMEQEYRCPEKQGREKQMDSANTVRETLRDFLQSWFEQRDPERTSGFLSENVDFVGTGWDESARGKVQMREYLLQDIREIPNHFAIIFS